MSPGRFAAARGLPAFPAFLFLLCAGVLRGLTAQGAAEEEVEAMARDGPTEAVAGEDVTLVCPVRNSPDNKVVSVEWRKGGTKLAVYSHGLEVHRFWPNVTVGTGGGAAEPKSPVSSLSLPAVTKWDAGVYVCDVTTFPLGSIRREMELRVRDVEVTCDANSSVVVRPGGNVTIRCVASPYAQYRWTKNEQLVSEDESLELLHVTDGHAGVYVLAVNTGNGNLRREFSITVQAETTTLSADSTTVSVTTEEATANISVTSPPTPRTSTSLGSTRATRFAYSSSARVAPDDRHLLSSSTAASAATHATSSEEPSNRSTPRAENPRNASSAGTPEAGTSGNTTGDYGIPGVTATLVAGKEPPGEGITETPDTNLSASRLVWPAIVPLLALVVVACFLYRRRLIKKRMLLPPPFKPPPPPTKYTAASHQEAPSESFPTSRCNSVYTQ